MEGGRKRKEMSLGEATREVLCEMRGTGEMRRAERER